MPEGSDRGSNDRGSNADTRSQTDASNGTNPFRFGNTNSNSQRQ